MKALILNKPGELIMADAPMPVPGRGELLIKTKAATICTSDLIDIKENPFQIKLPVIMGHEGAGVVEAIGSGVEDFCLGDEVAVHPVMPCGHCVSCKRGLTHLCDDMEHLGLNRGGVFAEYFVTRQDRVRKKPETISFAEATLMEPVCVCIEAIERGGVKENSNVIVIGDGPFGVMIAKLLKSYKPARIVLSGRHSYRLSQVKDITAVNERETENITEALMRATGGFGADCVILTVGNPSAVDTSISVLRSRGSLVLFAGISDKVPMDLFKVHVKELNICGSCNDMDYLDKALELLCDGPLELGKVITHRFPFDKWEDAILQAEKGKGSGLKVSMLF